MHLSIIEQLRLKNARLKAIDETAPQKNNKNHMNPHPNDESAALKGYAKILFTRDRLSQEEVSVQTGVHANTVNRWVAEGGWKKLQRNFVLTREEQMANMLDELIQLNASIRQKPDGKQFADSKESAVRHKLVRDIKNLETSASLSETINVAKGLVGFIRKIDLEKAKEVCRWADQYIKSFL